MHGPVSSHPAAETPQVVRSLGSQPITGSRAFLRPPAGPRDATSNARAFASDPHSGHSVWVARERRTPREKKRLSLERDRADAWGTSQKSFRKSWPTKKAPVRRA